MKDMHIFKDPEALDTNATAHMHVQEASMLNDYPRLPAGLKGGTTPSPTSSSTTGSTP